VAKQILQNVKLWVGGYDLSADHNSVTLGDGVELVVEPAFGDLIKTTYAGLKIADLGAAGLYNTAVTEPQLFANIGAVLPITVAPGVPSGAEGELAYFLNALEAQFDPITASVGQMAKFKFAARAAGGPLVRGLILRNTPAPGDAATGNGTVFQLGAIGAAQFLWAAVHVFALTGGTSPTLTLALQSAHGGVRRADHALHLHGLHDGAEHGLAHAPGGRPDHRPVLARDLHHHRRADRLAVRHRRRHRLTGETYGEARTRKRAGDRPRAGRPIELG